MSNIHSWLLLAVFVCSFALLLDASDSSEETQIAGPKHERGKGREGKLGIFTVFRFRNEPCVGAGTRNGTCLTAAECANQGGTPSGSCFNDFAVCCIFVLSCGQTSSSNCSYLVQASTTEVTTNPCTFTICKCQTEVCRLRFDFNTFNIDGPITGVEDGTNGAGVGDCDNDRFSVTSPGNVGTPIICGFNTGQHLFVDASDLCHTASFSFGSTSATRAFDIKVTQYTCAEEDLGGPPGCLQYFTGSTGTVASFNFPTTSTMVGATTTHLSDQCYNICFRQEENFCAICFQAVTMPGTSDPTNQASFGLSNPGDAAAAKSAVDLQCTTDYLAIPVAEPGPVTVGTIPGDTFSRLCGRFLVASATETADATQSVCTQSTPFRIQFKTDSNEVTGAAAPNTNELNAAPFGTIGFNLNWVQTSC